MNWSYRIARVFGIDIKVHLTFALIVLLFGWNWSVEHGVNGFLFGTALILALFLCVTLHELGHSLAAKLFDIDVREIILLPLGGVALLESSPTKPQEELVIALAGPLVNVLIVIALVPLLVLGGDLTMLSGSAMVQGIAAPLSFETFLIWLLEANVLLVLFNMIPAFPLDGGRVLRAVLAFAFGWRRATRIASIVGRTLAVLLGIFALVNGQFFLLLIAIFIYFGAGQEWQQEAAAPVALQTQRVGYAYKRDALTFSIGDRVNRVIDAILTTTQSHFAVLQGNRLIGIVSRDDVLRALSNAPPDVYVPEVYATTIMQRNALQIDAMATLDETRKQMQQRGVRVAAVYDRDMYLGLITLDDIAEAATLLTAVEHYKRSRTPTANQPPTGSVAGTGERDV